MGKDSEFYRSKRNHQLLRLRSLLDQLPGFAQDYIHSKEITSQPSTLVSYSYDLITFFTYIKEKNPLFKSTKITDFHIDVLEQITAFDIEEYQRYIELDVSADQKTIHENR